MRYIIGMIFLLIGSIPAFSQKFEVGPFIGGANYIGDVGNSTYLRPSELVFGGLVKWNQSTRHSYRFSLLYANLSGDDKFSQDKRRRQRGYHFENTLMEASLGVEFTFYEYDPFSSTPQATPYLYSGINYYFADHFKPEGGELVEAGKNWEFSIPLVMGYKLTLNSFLSAGAEIGARYNFSDNLDGSRPSETNEAFEWKNFGNKNTTDWYVFTGIYLTFNFGIKPCYTHF